MKWLLPACAVLTGTALLAAMQVTNPGYNDAFRPFVTDVPRDGVGETRLFGGQIAGWRSADRIGFSHFGRERLLDTQGVFLLVDLKLHARVRSTTLRATWQGASGREYAATARAENLPGAAESVMLQPGLTMSALAIFELPPDEIAGGALILAPPLNPPLDGALRLQPPAAPPGHRAEERFDR